MAYFTNNSGAASGPAATNSLGDISADMELSSPPEDSISDLSFSMQADLLAVASWDKKVRVYEISSTGRSAGKAVYEHDGPVLSVSWSQDGTKVASGGADKAARVYDLVTGQSTQIAVHDDTIRSVGWFTPPGANSPMVATGSWDKTLKYWDLRQPQPAASIQLQERVYSMDIAQSLLVVGTAERHINIINLSNPGTIYKTMMSPLKWQTRVVSCFPDGSGFAVGSIEGRCAFQYIDEKSSGSNFSFKCHRKSMAGSVVDVYGVSAISFHPIYGTFSTAGADATFNFWDKDAKHRIKAYPSVGGTISATGFNRSGSIFAYAVSYDWSKGHQFNNPNYPNKVMLHPMKDDEAKPRIIPKKR